MLGEVSEQANSELKNTAYQSPPTTMVVSFQSTGVVVSAFLTKMEHFKSQLLYLEECVDKAINCDNSGNIHEIEGQLQKLQVNMEALLTAATDMP